jgi:hypothetical protein
MFAAALPADPKYPVLNKQSGIYTDSLSITMTAAGTGVIIRYTTDGSTPGTNSAQYVSPVIIKNSCILKAAGFLLGAVLRLR